MMSNGNFYAHYSAFDAVLRGLFCFSFFTLIMNELWMLKNYEFLSKYLKKNNIFSLVLKRFISFLVMKNK